MQQSVQTAQEPRCSMRKLEDDCRSPRSIDWIEDVKYPISWQTGQAIEEEETENAHAEARLGSYGQMFEERK